MIKARGFAAIAPGEALRSFEFQRRALGPNDILVDIHYCGVCHTDIDAVRNSNKRRRFPLVPGHEIVGMIARAGPQVRRFRVGDWVGVGAIVDSCRTCHHCEMGLEPYCLEGMTGTYGALDRQGQITYGGFANNYVVNEEFALRIPDGLDRAAAAPLLCAGITTYSPLHRAGLQPGQKVGIIGLGGLGHIAVKWARLFGAHVTVLTTTAAKAIDACRLGADEAIVSTNGDAMASQANTFDFILDTVSGDHDIDPYLRLLKLGGELCLVGMPQSEPRISPILLATGRRSVSGSMTGGINETQAMLDLAARNGVACDIELISTDQLGEAFERLERGDVRYRFVLDLTALSRTVQERKTLPSMSRRAVR